MGPSSRREGKKTKGEKMERGGKVPLFLKCIVNDPCHFGLGTPPGDTGFSVADVIQVLCLVCKSTLCLALLGVVFQNLKNMV